MANSEDSCKFVRNANVAEVNVEKPFDAEPLPNRIYASISRKEINGFVSSEIKYMLREVVGPQPR